MVIAGYAVTRLNAARNACTGRRISGGAATATPSDSTTLKCSGSMRARAINIISIDVFSLGQSLLGSTITAIPALETLVPGSSSCLLLNPATCPDVPLALTLPFFYWDIEHPTTYIHGILGRAMYDAFR